MSNFPAFLTGLGYFSSIKLDLLGCSHMGVIFLFIFYLLHVGCNNTGVSSPCCPDNSQPGCLRRNFWYGNPHPVVHIMCSPEFPTHQVCTFSLFIRTVEVAVAIIMCNISIIIPAILCALGVGDPFMREDIIDPNFSTLQIARMTSTRIELIELGVSKTHGTAIMDSDQSEGVTGTVVSRQQDLMDLGTKDDHKHQLMTTVSDLSLGDLMTKAIPLTDESYIMDLLVQVGNLLPVKGDQSIENNNMKSDNTVLGFRFSSDVPLCHPGSLTILIFTLAYLHPLSTHRNCTH